ncbi:MAG: ATP-binding protein [Pseudomonadota bacterium]|nr:ATP-binding protein [Pseudomonadota bacterium]
MLTVWTDAAWADGSSVAVEAAGSIVTGLGFALGIGFVALGLLVAGALYRRAERYRFEANDLRLRQAESAALGRLLDVWQWRTDRHHRLLTLNAPTGSVNARSLTLQDADPQPLWTHFTAVDARTGAACSTGHATLRQRIEAQQSAEDVLVRFDGDGHAAQFGLLRALPLHDERGDFMGHVGTVREQPAAAIALTPALETVATASAANAAAPSTADRSPAIPSLTPLAIPAEQDAESFSYTVSHDLRAPIRVVEGFTKIVKEDYGRLLDRVGNDHLDRVLGAAARMNSMIDALLALSQLSAKPVSRQPVNLSQLAGFVVDDLRRQWPQHPVTVHIDPSMQVHGDPTLLRVLLENLLGNAWKYTGKCPTPQVWFERCTDTTTPSFTVRDNGAGFDMRFADRLFGVFQRLHSASEFQGTGIGLASVRRIVTKHGGEVWAESEAGLGASFHFSLGNPPT